MVFSSIIFLLFFLPLFLLVYNVVPKRIKNTVILVASILFYTWGAPKFVFLLLSSTILDFYLVKWMNNSQVAKQRKLLLALSITLNVGLLVYFKYANFMVENVNTLLQSFGFQAISWTSVLLPIGISFYTFQTLTYSIDIYRKKHAPLNKVSDYLVYIMSFPQMIAGPIVRFNEIADEIVSRKETWDDKIHGLFRFSVGLSKKVLLANPMGRQADLLMDLSADQLSTPAAWVGIVAYTFQIYFDFSGYSDMAIGLGRMMGFTFPENFNSPYTSRSITEFWRRWHITLGTWMRDYLYIPLGGNRVSSKARLYTNLALVFVISGLWHGASWNFVFWGAFHGLFLILDRLFLINLLKKLGAIPSILITFLIVMVGWVFFRIESFSAATEFVSVLFWGNDVVDVSKDFETISGLSFYFVLAALFSIVGVAFKGNFWKDLRAKSQYSKFHASWKVLISLCFIMLSISFITATGFNPFIYFRF